MQPREHTPKQPLQHGVSRKLEPTVPDCEEACSGITTAEPPDNLAACRQLKKQKYKDQQTLRGGMPIIFTKHSFSLHGPG